jgi:hypothetical protein
MELRDPELTAWRSFYELQRTTLDWHLRCPRCGQNFTMSVVPYRRTRDDRWRLRKHAAMHEVNIPTRLVPGELVVVEGLPRRRWTP